MKKIKKKVVAWCQYRIRTENGLVSSLIRRVCTLSQFRGDTILDNTLNQDRIDTCLTLVLCEMPNDILLLLHGPPMLAIKAKIYGVLYKQALSL